MWSHIYKEEEEGGYVQREEGLLSKRPTILIGSSFPNSLLCFVLNNTLVRKVAPLSLKSSLKKKHLIR